MFNSCPNCGEYREEKTVIGEGRNAAAVCPACGYSHRFLRLPLFVVTGASGAGKTSVCLRLAAASAPFVVLEGEIFPESGEPGGAGNSKNLWLRVCKNIAQSGRPVVVFGSALPNHFEPCPERRYFSQIHYLALVCSDDVLEARLKAAPSAPKADLDELLSAAKKVNQWFRNSARGGGGSPISTIDTSNLTLSEVTERVLDWLTSKAH